MGFKECAVDNNDKLRRGLVYCKTCKKTLQVDSIKCLTSGWPECCGYTMTRDVPAKRADQ